MPENPHDKKDLDQETAETNKKSSSGEDQTARSYYYDDACGYEIYTDDENEEDENQTKLPHQKNRRK